MSESSWYQATCCLDGHNELQHAVLQNTNSPLTAHEPTSNVALGWRLPVLGPVIRRGPHAALILHQHNSLNSNWIQRDESCSKAGLRFNATATFHTTGAKKGTMVLEWQFYSSCSFSTKQPLVCSMTNHSIRPGTKQLSASKLQTSWEHQDDWECYVLLKISMCILWGNSYTQCYTVDLIFGVKDISKFWVDTD